MTQNPCSLTKSRAAAHIPFIPQHNKMDITSIFIPLTICKQSTLYERNAKESEGILDFLFILSSISEKQTCFHPGAVLSLHMCCCLADEFSSQSSAVQLKVFMLAFRRRCTIEPQGRKWRGGVWMRHKQEISFVFPPPKWHTGRIYSKLCSCILQAYLTQYALPEVYIIGAVERY